MPTPETFFPGRDGVRLAYREVGEGRPLVLLPGFSVETTLWLHHGQADRIAARGHRVIMPDFRGLGRSAKPRDAAAYPVDVLADDVSRSSTTWDWTTTTWGDIRSAGESW